MLESSYRILATSDPNAAVDFLSQEQCAAVIIDAEITDTVRVCRHAGATTRPPATLVTLRDAAEAPLVLDVCHSILMKPFAPNLLLARMARLLRERSRHVRVHSEALGKRIDGARARFEHLHHRTLLLRAGTHIEWPNTYCPYCRHAGVTLFDYASTRRGWYACRACRRVWIAPVPAVNKMAGRPGRT